MKKVRSETTLFVYNLDKSEQDISFEELKDNDHLRVQKRKLAVAAAEAEKESSSTTTKSDGQRKSESAKKKLGDLGKTAMQSKNEESEPKYTKKQLFDSELVQCDLFSPFPIEFYNSGYLDKGLQRIKFTENKLKHMKPVFELLWKTSILK